jgi:hypothetical protein
MQVSYFPGLQLSIILTEAKAVSKLYIKEAGE